ncbi:MAG: DUF86 domain-containing protein [Candidatus Taylorbacteria bacterium]|nr:DUF86 domain-containing protein [Candidatus Taylorbacteria bacterium]
MPNEDVIKSKLAAMSLYLRKLMPYLEKYRQGKMELHDPEIFIVERLFQLIADAAIDINTHIMTRAKLEPSDDYEGTFRILGKHGVLPVDLAEKISGSVGLRNRLVHGYEKIQRKLVMDDISGGIGQYVEYMKYIAEFVEKSAGKKT